LGCHPTSGLPKFSQNLTGDILFFASVIALRLGSMKLPDKTTEKTMKIEQIY
jgi:hypothetical protein